MAETESKTAKPNRMEQRRLKTRARLLKAALQLILKNGISKTTMESIADTADLGRQTLYYHFSSKDECILAAMASEFKEHAASAELLEKPSDPALMLATHSRSVMQNLLDSPLIPHLAEYPRLLASALEDAVSEFALRDIDMGLSEGRFKLAMSVEILERVLIWSLTGLLIEYAGGSVEKGSVQSAYTVQVLANLGISSDEAGKINERAAELLSKS